MLLGRILSCSLSFIPAPMSALHAPNSSILQALKTGKVKHDINNSVNEQNWENELEELSVRLQEPINLNVATREKL